MGNMPKTQIMKNIIIIPDIHTYFERAEKICQKFEGTHDLILNGDFFDQFGDSVDSNRKTAEWLKYSLHKDNRIHHWGNHDLPYHPQINLHCSGFSLEKKEAINKILDIGDWDKLNFYTRIKKWYISHAGLNKFWFGDPITGELEEQKIKDILNNALEQLKIGYTNNCLWASDSARGGIHKWGGILWADWSRMEFIQNTNQIVSHTPVNRIQQISDNVVNSHLINVDSSLKTPLMEVLEIDKDGKPNVIQLPEIL